MIKMDIVQLIQTPIFNWIIMPILIIISRIFDVSLSTLRVIFTAKGYKKLAPVIGFFEVLIWIIVVRQIFSNVTNPLWFVAYAAGFGLGTYIGIAISEKLSMGEVIIRVITIKNSDLLIKDLKKNNYGVTVSSSDGIHSKGKIIFSVIHSKQIEEYVNIIKRNNPSAFFTIEDIRRVEKGHFKKHKKKNRGLQSKLIYKPFFIPTINLFRKGK